MNSMTKASASALRFIDVFNGLSDAQTQAMLSTSEARQYDIGKIFISQDDCVFHEYYFICSNLAIKKGSDANPTFEEVLHIFRPGDCKGVAVLFKDFQYTTSLFALNTLVVLDVDQHLLADIVCPEIDVLVAINVHIGNKPIRLKRSIDKVFGEIGQRIDSLQPAIKKVGVFFSEGLEKIEIWLSQFFAGLGFVH